MQDVNETHVNFTRSWIDYKEGFGDFLGDFWLGNDIIHQLTNEYSPMTLRIELEDFEDNWVYAEYAMFK